MVASNSPSIKNTEKSGTKWDTIRRREHNQFFFLGGGVKKICIKDFTNYLYINGDIWLRVLNIDKSIMLIYNF